MVRYIVQKSSSWDVFERFIELSDFDQKTREAITKQIKTVIRNWGLDLQLCRGQACDNASNMSGKFNGVQSRILSETPQAYFSPCGAHSLNLCGVHAMEVNVEMKSYFGNVQKLYKTFALSPSRWKILQTTANISLHSVSTTRWSARVDAVRPLVKRYSNIFYALVKISEETNLSPETQADVDFLTDWLKTYEFILLTSVWYKILQTIDNRNTILQSSKISVKHSENILLGLMEDIESFRDNWDSFLREAKTVELSFEITPELKPTRERIRKRFLMIQQSQTAH